MSIFASRVHTGCIPDERDERDVVLEQVLGSAATPLPRSHSLRQDIPVRRQVAEDCTGAAVAEGLLTAYLYRGEQCPVLSALHNYFLGRSVWGGEKRDEGSYLRTAMKALMRFGIASEKAWPESIFRVQRSPSWGAMRDGFDRRGLRRYYRIPSGDVQGVRRALAAGHPVVAGWRIDEAFTKPDGPFDVDVITGPIIGGHAMLIDGYDALDLFDLLNSWGPDWRDQGRVRVTAAFVARAFDLWALDCSGGLHA